MTEKTDQHIPLVVDMDGTLINTDLLMEGFIAYIRHNPLRIFNCLFWLLQGKVKLKQNIFSRIDFPFYTLPFNQPLLSFLQEQKKSGRKLVLATASPIRAAQSVAAVHPLFDEVYGTDTVNLKGSNKEDMLSSKYGAQGYDYVGNSFADLPVFAGARHAYLVNGSRWLEQRTARVARLKKYWPAERPHFLYSAVKAVRAYQWVKNLLVFVPLVTSHSMGAGRSFLSAFLAFLAFSFTASAGYVINDLFDLKSDRIHPRKCKRPFASGDLSLVAGTLLIMLMLACGFLAGFLLNRYFLLVLILYFVLSITYSVWLKRLVLFDVFVLSLLYSTRVIGGGVATGISISFWLIAFSTFLFLNLAFVKRFSELMKVDSPSGLLERGREYLSDDLPLLRSMGVVSGFVSVVVFSLYINSPEMLKLYAQPHYLWGISLLFLFWICRIWVVTNRGNMTDDPIIYTLKDRASYLIFLLVGVLLWLST
jgi:4-hydroxybenzoate polyprenyltransferase/phosphoserine phosphatase